MPSPFDAFDRAAQAAVDATFGEGVLVRPMAGSVNYGSAPDPTRPEKHSRAIISRAAKVAESHFSGGQRSAPRAAIPIEAWFSHAAYAALGYSLRRGDLITLTDDPDQPDFEIAAVHEADGGDRHVPLTARDDPPA